MKCIHLRNGIVIIDECPGVALPRENEQLRYLERRLGNPILLVITKRHDKIRNSELLRTYVYSVHFLENEDMKHI